MQDYRTAEKLKANEDWVREHEERQHVPLSFCACLTVIAQDQELASSLGA